jgi:hypothetical protein
MRITKRQLRRIIEAEIHGNSDSHAESSSDKAVQNLEHIINGWSDQWQSDLLSEYDESDPIMSGYGLDSWKRQVQAAANELRAAAAQAAMQEMEAVEGKLYGGEYS